MGDKHKHKKTKKELKAENHAKLMAEKSGGKVVQLPNGQAKKEDKKAA